MMSERLRIKIAADKTDKIIFAFTISFLLLNIAFAIWQYCVLPKIIPSHFNAAGNIDKHSDKGFLIILPVIGIFIFSLLQVLLQYPEIYNYPQGITKENAPRYYRQGIKMLRFVNLGCAVLIFSVSIITFLSIQNKHLILPIWAFSIAAVVTTLLPALIALKLYSVKK